MFWRIHICVYTKTWKPIFNRKCFVFHGFVTLNGAHTPPLRLVFQTALFLCVHAFMCSIIAFVSEVQGRRTQNTRGPHYIHNGRFGRQSRGWGKVRVSVFHWWAWSLLANGHNGHHFEHSTASDGRGATYSFTSHTMGPAAVTLPNTMAPASPGNCYRTKRTLSPVYPLSFGC